MYVRWRGRANTCGALRDVSVFALFSLQTARQAVEYLKVTNKLEKKRLKLNPYQSNVVASQISASARFRVPFSQETGLSSAEVDDFQFLLRVNLGAP